MYELVIFGGAHRWFLLPLDRAMLAISLFLGFMLS